MQRFSKTYTIMKKIFILLTLCIATNVLFAAERLQIKVNYTKGLYKGLTYSAIQEAEPDFIKDKSRYEGRFLEEFEKKITEPIAVVFTNTPDKKADYMTINILTVSPKGNLVAEVSYKGQTKQFKCKGGTFGSFLNLFGDGMGSLGKDLAKWIHTL